MPTVLLRTLGCRLNQAESFEIEEGLLSSGFELAQPGETPDLVIVNTCTVTADSTRSSRQLVARMAKEHPDARLVVTGCYAVAAPGEVRKISGVDDVVPNKDKDSLVDFVRNVYFPTSLRDAPARSGVPPRVTLKVQTGCDEMCTFCIVPYTRGGLLSRKVSDVIAAAVGLAERGARELTLSGVHLGKYGVDHDHGIGLYDLVCRLLDSLPGEVRIRLSSIEVTCVEDRLLNLVASEPRLCRHLHIPLQSGDDGVLKAMGRSYDSAMYKRVASAIKEQIPGVALTTDVMVGFPGETPSAFDNTLSMVESLAFSKLHVFRYSAREGTPASCRSDQISDDEKKRRSKILRDLGDQLRFDFQKGQASKGELQGVLIEGHGPAGADRETWLSPDGTETRGGSHTVPTLFGITDNYIKVVTAGPAGCVGKYAKIKPSGVFVDRVEGELVLDFNTEQRSTTSVEEMPASSGS